MDTDDINLNEFDEPDDYINRSEFVNRATNYDDDAEYMNTGTTAVVAGDGDSSESANGADTFNATAPRMQRNGNGDFGVDGLDNADTPQRDVHTLFFRQCEPERKRIDFVLVFQEKSLHDVRREMFEDHLQDAGLQLEYEDVEDSSDKKNFYVKIHAPWKILAKGAELIRLKKRLKISMELKKHITPPPGCFTCCVRNDEIVPEETEFFAAIFNDNRENIFDIGDREKFFTNAERSLIVKNILDNVEYFTKERERHIGVDSLVRHKVYTGAYPLHEGSLHILNEAESDPDFWIGDDKDRLRLYEAWARPKNMLRTQPLDLIRKYFGEKIGLYFAWLGIYTILLIPAAVFGVGVFLYGLITLPNNTPSIDICNNGVNGTGRLVMCPACDVQCYYQNLSGSCIYAQFNHVFDNYGTVALAIFMSVWALVFIEIWKREQTELQYDWDIADYEAIETPRPEFLMKVRTKKLNPITGHEDPYLKWYNSFGRQCTAMSTLLFVIILVLGAIFGVIVYRLAVVAAIYQFEYPYVKQNSKLITTVTAAGISLIAILILGLIYKKLALVLTNLELHRTNTSYEASFTTKLIIFEFINNYGTIFYIAFFKGSFIDPPGQNSLYVFGRYRQDQCDPSGCLVELSIQLIITMVGKQIAGNAMEIVIPLVLDWYRSRDNKDKSKYMSWERDGDLTSVDSILLFSEYLEMIIQFGFVTIFVAAFPLAPLCALINNMIEIRLDAYKFIKLFQRPIAHKAQNIGPWFTMMEFIAFISVITNAFIIAWTSEFIPRKWYQYNNDNSLVGYVNYSLSVFNTSDFNGQGPDAYQIAHNGNITYDTCRYPGYYNPPGSTDQYDYSPTFWQIFTARLAFVIVFEHACFALIFIVMVLIPDKSARVKRLQELEKELTYKIAYDAKFSKNTVETRTVTKVRQRRSTYHRNGSTDHFGD